MLFLFTVATSAPSPEHEEINAIVTQHVLNQANIPVSFRMTNPSFPFIGRVAELSEIKWAHVDKKIVVLTGPRGVGKSELAKKYAHDFKLDNISSTIWINSESHLSMRDAFRDLAITVGVSTEQKSGTTIIHDVINHFANRKTLFIFDNAESSNRFIGNLENWIGDSSFINVIVTSRNENWDTQKYRIVPIVPFTLEEATQYIKAAILKDISLTIDDESCKKLAELLQFNPLALSDSVKEIVKQNSLNPSKLFTIIDFVNSFNPSQPVQITQVRGPTDEELEDAVSAKIKEEWQRAGDRITDEAKRFGNRVAAEGKRIERQFKKIFG